MHARAGDAGREIRSQAGWSPDAASGTLDQAIKRLKASGIRVSLFVRSRGGARDDGLRASAPIASSCILQTVRARLRIRRRLPDEHRSRATSRPPSSPTVWAWV
jgi:pyridoxine 5'-phosphate synthase PdxJ